MSEFSRSPVTTANPDRGFTLIELIVVIAILGILGVVAIPHYVSMQRDARIAALGDIAAQIDTAARMTYYKAAALGVNDKSRSSPDEPPAVEINGMSMELKYGYPEAWAEGSRRTDNGDIISLLELSQDLDVCYGGRRRCERGNSSRVKIGFDTQEGSGCYVRYSEPGGTVNPGSETYLITVVDVGC